MDFVLCYAATMRPLLGIELDDASHERADRIAWDAFVDRVFEAAGLPLLHVKAARAYQPEALLQAVREKLGMVVPPPLPVTETTAAGTPSVARDLANTPGD